MQRQSTTIAVRIDYTFDPTRETPSEAREYAEDKVIRDARAHMHTIEGGLQVHAIERCEDGSVPAPDELESLMDEFTDKYPNGDSFELARFMYAKGSCRNVQA